MIPLAEQSILYETLLGEVPAVVKTQAPFAAIRCDFLAALSATLLHAPEAKQFPDVITFAYDCRRANLEKLKSQYSDLQRRLGLGMVFHIAPANVPINFIFSFLMGFLSGNANIVRVPTTPFPQVNLILEKMGELLEQPSFTVLKNTLQFIRYEKNDEITTIFSRKAHARLLWGGDETIAHIRALPASLHVRDIVFSDRYSLCLLQADQIRGLSEEALNKLAQHFYNDAYTLDQRACASPQAILWIGKSITLAQQKFWGAVKQQVAARYHLSPIFAVDKYTQWCENAIDYDLVPVIQAKEDNFIHRISFTHYPASIEKLRGHAGYFYEFSLEKEEDFLEFVKPKCQTLTYFGVDPDILRAAVINKGIQGVDRIVPVGSALAMSLFWDGYDIIRLLSRVIVT